MFKFLSVSVLLVAVKSEYNVNELVGDWLPAVTYPKTGYAPYCYWSKFTIEDSWKCTCNGRETPALTYVDSHTGNSKTVPTIFIGETEPLLPNLRASCSCNGNSASANVIRKLNADYIVGYHAEAPLDLRKNEYYTSLHVKKVPKLSELQAVLDSHSDFRGKELEYWCDTSFYLA